MKQTVRGKPGSQTIRIEPDEGEVPSVVAQEGMAGSWLFYVETKKRNFSTNIVGLDFDSARDWALSLYNTYDGK